MCKVITIDGQDYEILGYTSSENFKSGDLILFVFGVEEFSEGKAGSYVGDYLLVRKLKWIPEAGEKFFYISELLEVEEDVYSDFSSFNTNLKTAGNVFRTHEEAVVMRDKWEDLLGKN